MAYTKQNFQDGKVLTAQNLSLMEDGIISKQDITDETLATTDKTVIGAINEVNGKTDVLSYDTTNEGYFFRVVGGVAGWYPVPNAEDNTF